MPTLLPNHVPTSSVLHRDLHVRRRHELLAAGLTSHGIRTAVERGLLIATGSGFYATPATPHKVLTALIAGTRLTCRDGAAIHGLWTPLSSDQLLHVACRRSIAPRAHTAHLATGHYVRTWPTTEAVLPLLDCLAHAARCLSHLDALILLESALNLDKLSRDELEVFLDALPARTRRDIGPVSALSQSGTETIVARFFRSKRVPVHQQVTIAGVGRPDMLIGDRLIVECDSRTHHDSPSAYESDRRRDMHLAARGFLVLRLTWQAVMLHWEQTRAVLEDIIARGGHRKPLRPAASWKNTNGILLSHVS